MEDIAVLFDSTRHRNTPDKYRLKILQRNQMLAEESWDKEVELSEIPDCEK
jgi:hypothetical protein